MKVYWAIKKPIRNTYTVELKPGEVDELGEDERRRGVVARDEDEHEGDDGHAEDVPPGQTSERKATTRTPKVLSRPWMTRMPA